MGGTGVVLMQSQAEYREAMQKPVTLTVTRAQMQMLASLAMQAETVYWNGGKPLPGHAGAASIVDAMRVQVPQCVGETYSAD